jgi:hypothetical protein
VSQTIPISERSVLLLNQQASARGKSLEEWVEELAVEHAQADSATLHYDRRVAVEGILGLQKQVKPDPEGWTTRDTVHYGRR